jgi:hypothetical protein
MLPADPAARAGSTPEASGDSSSGTFSRSMKTQPAYWILSLLLALTSCERIGGISSNYPAKDFDPLLTQYAQSATPLIRALDSQIKTTGTVPESLGRVLLTTQAPKSLSYLPEKDYYRLYIKLGWDPSLFYDSRTHTWTFDPGDGKPQKVIKIIAEPDAAPNGSPGGSLKSAAIASPAQSRMLLPQPPRLHLAPFCCHPPVSESRG